MNRRVFLLALGALALAACATAPREPDWAAMDPGHAIRPALLADAIESYRAHVGGRRRPPFRRDVMAVVDFARSSDAPRLYLLDLRTGAVEAYLVAHGAGSDLDNDGMAERFTNASGSHASSLGAYRVAERYSGRYGLALRLDGLDASNAAARPRAIVLHSQWYASAAFAAQYGRLGRSWGCFVVDPDVVETVVARLEGGAFLYAGR